MDNDRVKGGKDLKNPTSDATGPTHLAGADLKRTRLVGKIHRMVGATHRDEHKQR
jgi:hypothetical protein